jgi:protein-tyrosine phosphatase
MRQVAEKRGFQYGGRSRQFSRDDFNRFDLIIAMDKSNLAMLETWAPTVEDLKKIRLMREFDPEGNPQLDVPDPYYGGLDGFESTYTIVERSYRGLLEALESGGFTS